MVVNQRLTKGLYICMYPYNNEEVNVGVFNVEGWKPVNLRTSVIEKLDKLKEEFGVRGRSEVIERLVEFYYRNKNEKGGDE